MDDKKIYDMKLHEELPLNPEIYILRVSGGWIYRFFQEEDIENVFVPYNNEFQ